MMKRDLLLVPNHMTCGWMFATKSQMRFVSFFFFSFTRSYSNDSNSRKASMPSNVQCSGVSVETSTR